MMIVPQIIVEGRITFKFEDGDCTEDVVWELVGDEPADIEDEGDVGVDTRGDNGQQMFGRAHPT
jgi:hypothetical protein